MSTLLLDEELPDILPVEEVKFNFLGMTGYAEDDILAWNPLTSKFLTRNGGFYVLEGDSLLHISGPSPDPEERL
jgi:hypothetical protein